MWIGAVLWQIGYDFIYAYVDAKDDVRIGIKSTALRFGRNGKACIGALYTLAVIAWAVGGWQIGMTWHYHAGIGLIALHLGWQVHRFSIDRPELNFHMFLQNIGTGALLMMSAFAGLI